MDLNRVLQWTPDFLRGSAINLALKIAPRDHVQRMQYNDNAVAYADLRNPFARTYFLMRSFEPEYFRICRPFLVQDGVVFDVGAHFGFHSFGLMAAAMCICFVMLSTVRRHVPASR